MTSPKIWVLASAILVLSGQGMRGQESEPTAERVARVGEKLVAFQKVLAGQESLSLVVSVSGHMEPGFENSEPPDYAATFKLVYKGKRFRYEYDYAGSGGKAGVTCVETFDGERYALLNRSGGILSISSKRFVNDVVMRHGHHFFTPFLFLQSGFKTDAFAQLSYEHLTNPDDWGKVLNPAASPAVVEETAVEGRSYLKVSALGESVDSYSKEKSLFDVYFAKDSSWYPTKWQRKSPEGEVIFSYTVEELAYAKSAQGEDIGYPKIAIRKHYQDGKLRGAERIEITQIVFNTADDAEFTIDPTGASYIRDVDQGVKIKVPK